MLVEVVLEGCGWSLGCALAGGQLAEAFDVDGDGGEHVLQVGLGLAPVAAVAHAVAVGELADGALDAGPHSVALVPGGVLLVGAVTGLQLVELARGEAYGALAVAGGGARGPGRAGLALAPGELGHDLPQRLHPGAAQQARKAGGQVLQQPAASAPASLIRVFGRAGFLPRRTWRP